MFLDLLAQELGEGKSAGQETRFCCPFCGEVKHKFYVHNTKGLWTCFRCGEKGNPVSFVKEYYGVSFPEACDILYTFDYDVKEQSDNRWNTSQYGTELTPEEQLLLFISREGQPYEGEKEKRYVCPKLPTNIKTLVANFDNPEAYRFFTYLHSRGVTLDQIKKHNISYVIHGEVELTNGEKLTLHNHLIFFTMDDRNRPMYWNTRSIDFDPFIKSFNGASKEGEYSKGNTIFNLNHAKHTDKIVICEGVFNALTVGDSGVASFGKQITDDQLDLLIKETQHKKQPIYLFLDTDAWEQTIYAAKRIKNRDPHRDVYYVSTGTEEDANDIGTEKVKKLLHEALRADSEGEIKFRLFNIGN